MARQGTLLARVHPLAVDDVGPETPPVEEIIAPFDAVVAVQRLHGHAAPRHARIVGLRRVVVADGPGRIRWLVSPGPVSVGMMVALLEIDGALRPHRAHGAGFVGQRFARAGERVAAGVALIEIRGEEMG